jgi:hypothetical protein
MTATETANPDKALEVTIRAKVKEVVAEKDVIDKLVDDVVKKVLKGLDKIIAGTGEVENADKDKKKAPEPKKEVDKDKAMAVVSRATGRIADVGVGFLKKTFSLVESLYAQLKKSSPLLQAIEQLFNLAWTLFFMPIGNKLGEMLIPAVIQLMDDVMDIWDAFDGMSLGEMLEYAVTKGVEILSRFIITIGEQLSEQSGLVGSIGNMLLTVGNFLQKHGEAMLNTLSGVAGFILDHLKEIIALIVAFKAMSAALQIQLIYATYRAAISSLDWGKTASALGGMALATVAIGAITGGAAYAGMNAFAEGGYVPATPGGQLAIIGEGGEGEYVIPESKMGQMGGNHYTINNYMMSTDELDRHIREVVRGEVSASRLRSGF